MAWAKDKHKNGHVLFISPVNSMHLCWIRQRRVVPCGWAWVYKFLTIFLLSCHPYHTHTLSPPHSHTHSFTLTISELSVVEASSKHERCGTWCLAELSQKHRGHVSVGDVMVPDPGYLGDVTEQILFGLEEQPAWLEQRKLIHRGTGHGLNVACCVNLGAVISQVSECGYYLWVMGNHGLFLNAGLLRYNLHRVKLTLWGFTLMSLFFFHVQVFVWTLVFISLGYVPT